MNPWIIIAFAIALAVSNAGSFLYGQHVEEAEAAQAQLETERLAAAVLKLKRDKVAALDLALAKANAARAGRDRIITQEVARYEHDTHSRRLGFELWPEHQLHGRRRRKKRAPSDHEVLASQDLQEDFVRRLARADSFLFAALINYACILCIGVPG